MIDVCYEGMQVCEHVVSGSTCVFWQLASCKLPGKECSSLKKKLFYNMTQVYWPTWISVMNFNTNELKI